MKILHLRHLALYSPEPAAHAAFYTNIWGLQQVAEQDGSFFLRGTSSEPFILALLPRTKRGIARIAFALADKAAVDSAAQELAAQDVPLYRQPAALTTPGGGYGFQIVDPEGRCLEFSCDVAPANALEGNAPVRPTKISHAVLNTTAFEVVTDFYTQKLGMRISDWSENQMVFLRCNSDHHSIAFNRAPHTSLNHIAYEVPDIDKVMRGIGNMKRNGFNPLWGPGRHGPGNNVFAYFQDVAGYVCEYTADIHQIDEASHQPQVWERVPEKVELWGTSGPPNPEVRAAMAGEPDLGVQVKA